MVKVGGGDGTLEFALEVFSRQAYRYGLSNVLAPSVMMERERERDALFGLKELLSE